MSEIVVSKTPWNVAIALTAGSRIRASSSTGWPPRQNPSAPIREGSTPGRDLIASVAARTLPVSFSRSPSPVRHEDGVSRLSVPLPIVPRPPAGVAEYVRDQDDVPLVSERLPGVDQRVGPPPQKDVLRPRPRVEQHYPRQVLLLRAALGGRLINVGRPEEVPVEGRSVAFATRRRERACQPSPGRGRNDGSCPCFRRAGGAGNC